MNYYLSRNKKYLDTFIEACADADKARAFAEGVGKAVNYMLYVLVAGILFLSSESSGGQLVAMMFIVNYLLETTQQLHNQIQGLIRNFPVFNTIMDVVSIPIIHKNKKTDEFNELRLDKVSLVYPNGREILNNVTLNISKGENVLVTGANGSGKSSLIKIISGLINPSSGDIYWNGKSLSSYDKSDLWRSICYVSQNELMLNESVVDYLNIVAHTQASNDTIAMLREKVHLNSEIDRIEDNGRTLSGGEKKKMAMLKCMLREEASIIIFDEIDAGLDQETRKLLKQLESDLLANPMRTVIKISHIDTDSKGYNKTINLSDG